MLPSNKPEVEGFLSRTRDRHPLIATLTLGCKLNQAESQGMARQLQLAGCEIIDRPVPADAYLINTCTITSTADRKARRLIRMAKRLSPKAPIVVTGCYADWAKQKIIDETGADIVLNNRAKDKAPSSILNALKDTKLQKRRKIPNQNLSRFGGRTRAFLKIQEGCNDVCAFCIVPHVRGRETAKTIHSIVREAQQYEADGVLEIVLTGTQPGAYGRDRNDETTAARLLSSLLIETTLPRIRYSSIQPQDITNAFIEQWQDSRLCRHFHLALQSGSDSVLQRMRRQYNSQAFLLALERIRNEIPGANITTDVIVGFPGETTADFEKTVTLCKEAQFSAIHVFPYSTRPKTSAVKLPNQIAPEIKRQRVQILQTIAAEGSTTARNHAIGKNFAVLFERQKHKNNLPTWLGFTDTYLPVQISARSTDTHLANQLATVHIENQFNGVLHGSVLE